MEFVKDKPDHLLQPPIRIEAKTEMPIPDVADRRRESSTRRAAPLIAPCHEALARPQYNA
jgi:hypothetical protein